MIANNQPARPDAGSVIGQYFGDSGRLKITLTECDRAVSFNTTLAGDTIGDYIDVFRAALRAFGFAEATVLKYLPEDGE